MVTAYWMGEYAKVLIGYVLVMYLWPRVVFRGHLRGKSRVYQFGFCVTAQVLLLNTLVLGLGMLHILNRWTVNIILYGAFLLSAFWRVRFSDQGLKLIANVSEGSMGPKTVLLRAGGRLFQWGRALPERVWRFARPHLGEYAALTVLLAFGMTYFSWGAFQDNSYGFGDIYIHHQWLYEMMDGTVFPDGVYPLAMHSVIYAMNAMFGVGIYSVLLFLQGIHVAAFLLSAYCLLRELFHWRYTPVLALALFLILRVENSDQVFAMSRLQWTIPQEFGLYNAFLCGLFLLRYIKSAQTVLTKKGRSRFCWDENLLGFALALGASAAVHFYITIMAFFICLAVALIYARQVFVPKRVAPLAISVLCALLLSLSPMLAALGQGIPLQGSIHWAKGILDGTDNDEGRTIEAREEIQRIVGAAAAVPEEEGRAESQTPPKPSVWKELSVRLGSLYRHGYGELYGTGGGIVLMALTVLWTALWALWRWGLSKAPEAFRRRIAVKNLHSRSFQGWPVLLLASLLLMLVYVAPYLGLPELVAGSRLCSTLHMLLLAVSLLGVDFLFTLLACWCRDQVLAAASLLGAAGVYAGSLALGCYHGFLYFELTRYNAAVLTTNSIINEFPAGSYTIVSTTDELYPVSQHGWHEELVEFVQKSREEG